MTIAKWLKAALKCCGIFDGLQQPPHGLQRGGGEGGERGDRAVRAEGGVGAAEVGDCSLLSACIVHSCTAQNSRVHCGQQILIDDGKLKGFL